jgi:mRNA-degrading endonuclease RelE of RelBE toxin-antitoxin system
MKYYASRTYSIAIHKDALDDLDRIYELDEDTAADIEAFLEEAKNNQRTLENLTRNGYVDYGEWPYDVKEWLAAKGKKLNLWRLRLLWLTGSAGKYRVVYAFHPNEFRYYVLGIVDRDFDYDLCTETSKRIIASYEALDIPSY